MQYSKLLYISVFASIQLLSAFFTHLSVAQNVKIENNGPLVYLLKLPNEQVKKIENGKYSVPDLMAFAIDSAEEGLLLKAKGSGNYFTLMVDKDQFFINRQETYNWKLLLLDYGRKTTVRVFDEHLNEQKNCRLIYKGKAYLFDDASGAFELKKLKNKSAVTVSAPAYMQQFILSKQRVYRHRNDLWFNMRYGPYKKPDYSGFIAFSQPIYRPGDTMKIKAFVVDKKGRPLQKEVELSISTYAEVDGNYGRFVPFKQNAKAVTKGAYEWLIPVSDTFKIDMFYEVWININNSGWIQEQIKIEDYELDKTAYSLSSAFTTTGIKRGDNPVIAATATDANGNPVLDATMDIFAYASINTMYADTLFVPDTLWQTTMPLSATGKTAFEFPPSLIPEASGNLQLYATFRNSNNELHQSNLNLTFDNNPFSWKITADDSVKVLLLRNNEVVADSIWVDAYGADGEVIYSIKTANNSSFKILPITAYCKFADAGRFTDYQWHNHTDAKVIVQMNRNNDTLKLQISNPRKLQLNVVLNKDGQENKRFTVYADTTMYFFKAGKHTYDIKCTYLWQGNVNSRAESDPYLSGRLKVSYSLKNEVQPGEQDTIEITVKNEDNKPVAGANITAAAYNAQFPADKYPDLPYLRKTKSRQKALPYMAFRAKPTNRSAALTRDLLPRFNLTDRYYYKMRFPTEGVSFTVLDSTPHRPQVAVYLHKKDKLQKIIYLKEGRHNMLHNSFLANNERAYLSPTGKLQLRVRLNKYLVVIDSVPALMGKLTVVNINLDSTNKLVHVYGKRRKLNYSERREIANTSITFSNNDNRNSWVLITPHQLIPLQGIGLKRHYGPVHSSDDLYLASTGKNVLIPQSFQPGWALNLGSGRINSVRYKFWKHHKARLKKQYHPKEDTYYHIASERRPYFPEKKPYLIEINQLPYTGNCRVNFISKNYQQLAGLMVEPMLYNPPWLLQASYAYVPQLPPDNYRFTLLVDSFKYGSTYWVSVREGGTMYINTTNLKWQQNYMQHREITDKFDNSNFPEYYTRTAKSSVCIKLVNKNDGTALSHLQVYFQNTGNNYRYYHAANTDGYVFATLPDGNYNLMMNSEGYSPDTVKGIKITGDGCYSKEIELLTDPLQQAINKFNEYGYFLGFSEREAYRRVDGISLVEKLPTRGFAAIASKSVAVKSKDRLGRSNAPDFDGMYDKRDAETTETVADSVMQLPEANVALPQLRTDFKDNAYWFPNVFTGNNGKVSLSVKYPDDITAWKHYAAAITVNKQTGLGQTISRSYKKVATELALPRFAIEGDELLAVAKGLNYTGIQTPVTFCFHSGRDSFCFDTIFSSSYIRYIPMSIPAWEKDRINKLSSTLTLKLPNGYRDGEQRELDIYPVGTELHDGFFSILNSDTSFSIQVKPNSLLTLHAENSTIDFLLENIEKLLGYPYACNEQIASKLRGLLALKTIKESLGQSFDNDKDIKQILKELSQKQRPDGTWGWWQASPFPDFYMTAYITEACYMAQKAGYKTEVIEKATLAITQMIDQMPASAALKSLECLSLIQQQFDYAAALVKIGKNYDKYDRFGAELVKARTGLGTDRAWLEGNRKSTFFGNTFYDGREYSLWHSEVMNTLKMMEINRIEGRMEENKSIIRYFLEQKNRPQGWNNTLETALILEAIMPDFIKEKQSGRTGRLYVNGSEAVFPYTQKFTDSQRIDLRYNGTETVYFTAYNTRWVKNPEPFTRYFTVQTSLNNNKPVVTGKNAELKVTVSTAFSGDYLMLSVPIPAGCSYADKQLGRGVGEVHREYYRNRVLIYLHKMLPGTYTYAIPLEVRYAGRQTLNPATINLMYFPTFEGNNEIKKVEIK